MYQTLTLWTFNPLHILKSLRKMLFEDLGTFFLDFKKVAQQVVAKHWDWEPDDFDDPQELVDHVLELYNYLMEGTKYIHGNCDEEGKFNNFSSAALWDLCVTGYYIGKSSLAASFSDIFSKCFPTGALAFAVTALTAAMDEPGLKPGTPNTLGLVHYHCATSPTVQDVDSTTTLPPPGPLSSAGART
ncbi:hypothetical protein EDC04DRAFT_2614280 [Pisolithus marmoratus]|nr:hypothetical protein EDC04DRAFT_2614280 [Pisolithus marmoratus]